MPYRGGSKLKSGCCEVDFSRVSIDALAYAPVKMFFLQQVSTPPLILTFVLKADKFYLQVLSLNRIRLMVLFRFLCICKEERFQFQYHLKILCFLHSYLFVVHPYTGDLKESRTFTNKNNPDVIKTTASIKRSFRIMRLMITEAKTVDKLAINVRLLI